MDSSSSKQECGVLVTLVGRMDAVTAPQFEQACDPWIKAGEKYIVADLSRLEYISSMGLGSLLSVAKKLQPAGGKLAVCGLAGMVKEVFRLSGFDKLIPGFENADAAFQKL